MYRRNFSMRSITTSPREAKNFLKSSPFSFAALAASPNVTQQKRKPKMKVERILRSAFAF